MTKTKKKPENRVAKALAEAEEADQPVQNGEPEVDIATLTPDERVRLCEQEIGPILQKYRCEIRTQWFEPVPVGSSGETFQLTARPRLKPSEE